MTIDAAAAQRFLAAQFDAQVRDVEPAGAGAWSRAFSFRRGADELIVRFGSHGDDFAKDRRAYRYHAPGLPVPEVLAVGPAFGGFYAISRRVWGTPLEHGEPAVWHAAIPSHIGLDHLAYNAFCGDWQTLAATAERMRALAGHA